MPRMNLDAIDFKILRALQENGRLSNVELADRVGLSPSPCLRRVRLLESKGVIAGYRALVDRKKIGYPLTVMVNVRIRMHETEFEKPFVQAVLAIPEVVACHLVSGNEDILLEVVTNDAESYKERVLMRIMAAPGMLHIRSDFVMRSYRTHGSLPT
jgi:Lrp/AsnC family transcriptional regulator, leucine-responsive regulatory protein